MKPLILPLLLLSLAYSHIGVAQTCKPNIAPDAPNNRYRLSAEGTAFDKQTGLVWMRCALGQTWAGNTCTGTVREYTWQGALQAAESTVFAGRSDWRLPNQKELQSLVEWRCAAPAINLTAFPNTPSYRHWSSSPVAYNNYYAWFVYFYYGYGSWDYKNGNYAVRLVRSGQ